LCVLREAARSPRLGDDGSRKLTYSRGHLKNFPSGCDCSAARSPVEAPPRRPNEHFAYATSLRSRRCKRRRDDDSRLSAPRLARKERVQVTGGGVAPCSWGQAHWRVARLAQEPFSRSQGTSCPTGGVPMGRTSCGVGHRARRFRDLWGSGSPESRALLGVRECVRRSGVERRAVTHCRRLGSAGA
jgi:hypothetical protein